MMGGDEIIFSGAYKGFKLETRFDLSGATDADVSAILAYISDCIEPAAYGFSEIDVAKVGSFASPSGKGMAAVLSFLKGASPSGIKDALLSACPDSNLVPAAESLMLNTLFKKAGVAFKPGPQLSIKAEPEVSEGQMAFVGRFGKWMAVKKLSLENVQDWEVSALLCGVNHTVISKAFDLSGAKKDDALVSELASGRKSLGNLVSSLETLQGRLSGKPLDDAYVVNRVCTGLGYPPYATPTMLMKAHDEVKPPKIKGRKPKE